VVPITGPHADQGRGGIPGDAGALDGEPHGADAGRVEQVGGQGVPGLSLVGAVLDGVAQLVGAVRVAGQPGDLQLLANDLTTHRLEELHNGAARPRMKAVDDRVIDY
jgi:hypothetical protein